MSSQAAIIEANNTSNKSNIMKIYIEKLDVLKIWRNYVYAQFQALALLLDGGQDGQHCPRGRAIAFDAAINFRAVERLCRLPGCGIVSPQWAQTGIDGYGTAHTASRGRYFQHWR